MIASLFLGAGGHILRGIRLDTKAIQRHARRDQIVNRQVEGDHRCQVSWLIEGST